MSGVLYKRRLAPQKYICAHECRRVTKFHNFMFSTCCFERNYGVAIHQYVYGYRHGHGTGTGMDVELVKLQ